MSILDIDERILDLIELVEFNKSPIDDIKTFTKQCDIGLIEGGCCNRENVQVLKKFRKHCKILVAVGECAIMGGLPAMRNGIPCGNASKKPTYQGPPSCAIQARSFPTIDELPMILDRVYPCHEIVKIDYFLPGCPPGRPDLGSPGRAGDRQ